MARSLPLHRRRRVVELGMVALGCLALANCTGAKTKLTSKVDPRYGVSASPRVIEPGQPVPKGGGAYRVGKPYVVAGRTYYPAENRRYRAQGIASWYGDDFHGRLTANGEVYDMEGISAAHPTMPMPSYARVTNPRNGLSLIVRVNDRGPYHADRVIDLSSKAAELLELRRAGTGMVRVEYVGPAALEGSDDRRLMATLREGAPAPAPSNVMVASAKPFVPDFGRTAATVRRPVLTPERMASDEDARRPWTTDARNGRRMNVDPVDEVEMRRGVSSAPLAAIPSGPQRPGWQPSTRSDAPDVREQTRTRYDIAPALATGRGLY